MDKRRTVESRDHGELDELRKKKVELEVEVDALKEEAETRLEQKQDAFAQRKAERAYRPRSAHVTDAYGHKPVTTIMSPVLHLG